MALKFLGDPSLKNTGWQGPAGDLGAWFDPHLTSEAAADAPATDDSWWAGAQRCFIAIPIAATLATVALSASLCWGAQQQNEEIVPQPAATALAGDEWIPPPVQKQASWPRVWSVDDEIVPQVVTMVEEDGWQPPSPPRPVILAQVWQTNEEVIPHVNDEYWHQTYSVRHGITRSGPEWDDQAPAGSLVGQPEDYPWTVYSPPYAPPKFLYLPDPEELPSGSLFGVPEQDTWAPAWVSRPLTPQPLVWADDEIVPQAAGFTPEEDYQPVQLAQPQAAWRKLWVGNESVVAAPVIDEPSWAGYTPSRALPTLLPLWVDDEIIPQAAGFTPEEAYQPVLLAQPQASWRKLWVADESVVVPPVIDEPYWVPAWVSRPLTPQPLVWQTDDEVIPHVEDGYWHQTYSVRHGITRSGPEWDDQAPVGFTPEEDYQPVQLAQPQATWKKLWVGNESVVQPQVPREEGAWTPPLVRPQASWRKLWVADESVVVPPASLFLEDDSWFPTVKFIPNTVPLTMIAVTVADDSLTQAVAPAEIMTWYYIPHTVRNSC